MDMNQSSVNQMYTITFQNYVFLGIWTLLETFGIIKHTIQQSNPRLSCPRSRSKRENTFSGIPAHFIQSGQRTP